MKPIMMRVKSLSKDYKNTNINLVKKILNGNLSKIQTIFALDNKLYK